jgi:hypothetical protein
VCEKSRSKYLLDVRGSLGFGLTIRDAAQCGPVYAIAKSLQETRQLINQPIRAIPGGYEHQTIAFWVKRSCPVARLGLLLARMPLKNELFKGRCEVFGVGCA